MRTGHSQNDEEEAIVSYFKLLQNDKRVLRFLDIGAHDGILLSNTRALAEAGWGGTLVEPSPAAFCRLMKTYQDRTDIDLVNAAITLDSGLVKFHDAAGDFVSTFDERHKELWEARPFDPIKMQPIYVNGVTVEKLVGALPGPYPFINIDVEGANFEVFKAMPLVALNCELICVEFEDRFVSRLAEIETLAARQGYRQFHLTRENVLLARTVKNI